MTELLRTAIRVIEAYPVTTAAVLIAVLLYLNLVLRDPRTR